MHRHSQFTQIIIPWRMSYQQRNLIQRDIAGCPNWPISILRSSTGLVKWIRMLTLCPDFLWTSTSTSLSVHRKLISTALSGVMALQNGDAVWITAVSGGTEALNLDSDLLDSRNYHKIEPQVILAAQKQDPSIGRVLACKLNGRKPAIREIAKELPYTRKLLREWPKLEIGRDGLLRRKSG